MYGYVRPQKGELKVSEYESYRAVYCGLCQELKKRGGFAARFAVNYDFTFLAMLLSGAKQSRCEHMRCPARLGKKRLCERDEEALGLAADQSLILSWWKLQDGIADHGLWAGLKYRAAAFLLKHACRKAAARRPAYAEAVSGNLAKLSALEKDRCSSLDAVADKFALVLRASALDVTDPVRRRTLDELFYHLGRVVYILDAVDDLPEDVKKGCYNPLIHRFSLSDETLSPENLQTLKETLQVSMNFISAAYELLEKNPWSNILSNIIYLGLPSVCDAVLSGQWREIKNSNKHRTDQL